MTKDEIKAMAIRCGFTLREQPYGNMDLYPYIYDFAKRLLEKQLEQMLAEGWRQCAKGQNTTQFCGQLEAAVLSERQRQRDKIEAHIGRTTMSVYGTQPECKAARDALQRLLEDDR